MTFRSDCRQALILFLTSDSSRPSSSPITTPITLRASRICPREQNEIAALGAISPVIYSGNCIDGGRHINYLADLAKTGRDIAGSAAHFPSRETPSPLRHLSGIGTRLSKYHRPKNPVTNLEGPTQVAFLRTLRHPLAPTPA